MQVCSRRPPPASPRASRKFASSEVSESESCGSDVSDKLSLLGSAAQTADRSGDKGTPVLVGGSNSSRGKTCASSASAAAKKTSAVGVGGNTPASKSVPPASSTTRRTQPSRPAPILECKQEQMQPVPAVVTTPSPPATSAAIATSAVAATSPVSSSALTPVQSTSPVPIKAEPALSHPLQDLASPTNSQKDVRVTTPAQPADVQVPPSSETADSPTDRDESSLLTEKMNVQNGLFSREESAEPTTASECNGEAQPDAASLGSRESTPAVDSPCADEPTATAVPQSISAASTSSAVVRSPSKSKPAKGNQRGDSTDALISDEE